MKKFYCLLVFILCFILNISVVSATLRTEENNYGINKKLPHPNITEAKKIPLVDASEKVYDYADLLTDDEEKKVYDLIQKFIATTHMDMVFVTIDEKYTHAQVEDYACDFYDYNDFGIDFKNYSGLILVRNNNTYANGKKYYYIATSGLARLYYADGGRLENLLYSIYDDFVGDNYLHGIQTLVNKSITYYERGYESQYQHAYIDINGDIVYNYHVPYLVCTISSLIITLIIMLILIKKNKMIRKATTAGSYLLKDSVNYTQSVDQFINSHTTSYTVSSSSGGGGSHGGSSGFGHGGGGRSG